MNTTSSTSPVEAVVHWIPALLVADYGLDDATTKSEPLPGAFATAQEAMAVAVAMLGIRPDAIAASARRMLQSGAVAH